IEAKKSVKLRNATGSLISAFAIGVRCWLMFLLPRSTLKARDRPRRSADQACGPSDMMRLRNGAAPARAASAARASSEEPAAATPRIWSPIATPTRGGIPAAGQKTPNGRFWIGNSLSGVLALSTQLRLAESWVSLRGNAICGGTLCRSGMVAGFCYEADMDIQSDSPWEIVP